MLRWRRVVFCGNGWRRHSSGLVNVLPGELGGVAGPVASGLACPAGGGAGGEVQQVGEDSCGELRGEVGEGGAAAGHGVDAKGASRQTARKGQGSYQEVGQHQERCQIVASISTMIGPPSPPAVASHRCRSALGKESPAMAESELFERGLQSRRDVLGAEYVDANLADTDEFMMAFQRVVTEWAWGYAWSRPGLDRKTRSMLNLAILTALWAARRVGHLCEGRARYRRIGRRNQGDTDSRHRVLRHTSRAPGVSGSA